MGRPHRIEFPGALYHIINRGNNKNPTFLDEMDYKVFLKFLYEIKKEKNFILYCYCLMPNHFHFLLETIHEPLSKIMQMFLSSYSHYFNKRHNKVGHLFQDRYKAIICDKENYFLALLRYIHLNPVRAKLTDNPDDYKWSSHQNYIGKIQNNHLAIEKVFNSIGGSLLSGYNTYISLINSKLDDNFQNDLKKSYKKCVLGTDEFINRLNLPKQEPDSMPRLISVNPVNKPALPEILDEVSKEFGVSGESIISNSQIHFTNYARKMFSYRSIKKHGYTLKEVADFIDKDPSRIYRYVKEIRQKI